MAIRTLFTQEEAFTLTIEMPGRIIPDPNASGLVQASVAGRLVPPAGGFPMLGSAVRKGDVMALVEPAMNAADAVSQQQESRALDQEITLAERKLQRLLQLEDIVARAQVEDLELELAGLRKRRANLDVAPAEPEALVAPVDGVIADIRAVAGQIADPSDIIFRIVDPSRLWVEALTYEVREIGPDATARLPDSQTLELRYQGAGFAERNQAVPVQFSIVQAAGGLRTGQLLTVYANASGQRKGIAVPRESVLRGSNGQSIVFEHANAERFVPREVRTEALDSERVLIVSGIETGKRIVTQGAELLNQIR
jgi:RND family efflux transporter MFP subunit